MRRTASDEVLDLEGWIGKRLSPVRDTWPGRFALKLRQDRIGMLASLVAWGMLNTFVPLILGMLVLVTVVMDNNPEYRVQAERTLIGFLPPQAIPAVQEVIDNTRDEAGAMGLISVGLIVFAGANFFNSLQTVFSRVYYVSDRPLLRRQLIGLGTLLLSTTLLLTWSVFSVVSATLGDELFGLELPSPLESLVAALLALPGIFVLFQMLYMLLPNRRPRFVAALPGAITAALLFSVILNIFPLYARLLGGDVSVYSAFGSLVVVLLWLYLVGLTVVAGAELNAFLELGPVAMANSDG